MEIVIDDHCDSKSQYKSWVVEFHNAMVNFDREKIDAYAKKNDIMVGFHFISKTVMVCTTTPMNRQRIILKLTTMVGADVIRDVNVAHISYAEKMKLIGIDGAEPDSSHITVDYGDELAEAEDLPAEERSLAMQRNCCLDVSTLGSSQSSSSWMAAPTLDEVAESMRSHDPNLSEADRALLHPEPSTDELFDRRVDGWRAAAADLLLAGEAVQGAPAGVAEVASERVQVGVEPRRHRDVPHVPQRLQVHLPGQ